MLRTWTTEQRYAQAERIRAIKPWERSTGPKTTQGKAIVSRNAYKGGKWLKARQQMKRLRAAIQLLNLGYGKPR